MKCQRTGLVLIALSTVLLAGFHYSAPQENRQEENTTDSKKHVAKTPEEGLQLFFGGIFEGDLEKARAGIVPGQDVVTYLETQIAMSAAMDRFAEADRKFIGDGKELPIGLLAKTNRANRERVKVVLDDESHAHWPLKPENPLRLVKRDGSWKVDMSAPAQKTVMKLSISTCRKTTALFNELTSGLEDGSLDSRDAVRAAMKRLRAKYGL